MLHKRHIGKRLSLLRRRRGFSQAELAEILGVSSQAVSKWETGAALPDIDLLLSLSHLYHVTINAILEERDLVAELTGKEVASDGITYFVPGEERDYNLPWAEEIIRGGWVARNYATAQAPTPAMDETGRQIAACDGIILELGMGPGGGFVPYILKANPDAVIICNDLSPTVLAEWKKLLSKKLDSPNLYYAAFDFCRMPFQDGCIDLISDGGGIGNCEGSKAAALREAWRVLKPGGRLVTSTGFVTRETLAALPAHAQKVLLEKRPDIFSDLYEETLLAGFCRIDSVIAGQWYTDDDDSTIADLARELGINLKFTAYTRYCTK